MLLSGGSIPLDRILGEQARHEGGIEICSNLHYRVIRKAADPAIAVVESETILRGRQGMKFYDRLIVLHEQMLDDELSSARQNLGQLREGPRHEIRFRLIVTGERMGPFDNPVDLIVYMLEKNPRRRLARDP